MRTSIVTYLCAIVVVFLRASCPAYGQNADTDTFLYSTANDEQAATTHYELFDSDSPRFSSYNTLRSGYIPVGYHFHGRRDQRIAMGGVDLAEGIVRASVESVPLRLRTLKPSVDSTHTGDVFGRRNYVLEECNTRSATRAVLCVRWV